MPAAGRVVEVDLDRLPGWVERFAVRHGALTIEVVGSPEEPQVVGVAAADGARADLGVPFGPLAASTGSPIDRLIAPGRRGPYGRCPARPARRLGGCGRDERRVVAADTGGGYVQGTTKAGGWSQQRYARRRGNQTQQVWDRAAVGAVEVFAAHRSTIGALVTGGDRAGVAAVLTDERLVDLAALVEPRFFAIGDPTRTVLDDVVHRLRCVVITLNELA